MSKRLNGGFLGPAATSVGVGIWSPEQHQLRRRAGTWPGGFDPYFSNVSLLLHMDGSDGSTSFVDSSAATRTVTAYASARISTTQSKYGGASGSFSGGNYLTVPSNAAFQFGTGDFTIEAWIYLTADTSSSYAAIIDIRNSASNNGAVMFAVKDGLQLAVYSDVLLASTTTLSLYQWQHVALVRSSGVMQIYINGTSASNSVSDSSNKSQLGNVYIGRVFDGAHVGFSGYLDEVRITKGIARYTSSFTPPTAAFPNG